MDDSFRSRQLPKTSADALLRQSIQPSGQKGSGHGASRGIGVEIATVFADAGAEVAIVGRDAEGLEATRQAIAGKGRRCVAIQADLRTVAGPRTAGIRAIEFLRKRGHPREQRRRLSSRESARGHGRTLGGDSGRQPPGSILLAQLVAPGMMAQRRGKIINVSSLAAKVGCEGHAAYSSSKGGLTC